MIRPSAFGKAIYRSCGFGGVGVCGVVCGVWRVARFVAGTLLFFLLIIPFILLAYLLLSLLPTPNSVSGICLHALT